MPICVERCLGTLPWDNNALRVAPVTAKVKTAITSSIFVSMGQERNSFASTECVNGNGVVTCKNQTPYVEIMEV